ncbi:MAG: polyprenyl synthetase family protein [Candidatus Sumerlaeia bacterium]|nr:polyprenyl synthetase family protein [Candidatus Sumerlaeia bacterium]
MDKESLLKYLNEKSVIIDRALSKLIPPPNKQIPNLHNALEFALGLNETDSHKRGKRFRPVLCLLTCEMLGGNIKQALPFAVATELMHNYCLVHDDIEDGDTVRRGRPAVWCQFGLAHGVNIGDYMLTTVFNFLISRQNKEWSPELTLRLIQLMGETLEHTLQGQSLDINARSSRTISMSDYLRIVREKTGYYLATPILGGAIIAGADSTILQKLRRYGRFIGPLFQIVDDLIDLTTGKGRNELGADIREGKRSFMVAYVLERCTKAEAKELFAILDKPRAQTSSQDVQRAISIMEKYQAVAAGREFCQRLKEQSHKALKNVPEKLRSALSSFAELLAERIR